jgi:hypothetical protein
MHFVIGVPAHLLHGEYPHHGLSPYAAFITVVRNVWSLVNDYHQSTENKQHDPAKHRYLQSSVGAKVTYRAWREPFAPLL